MEPPHPSDTRLPAGDAGGAGLGLPTSACSTHSSCRRHRRRRYWGTESSRRISSGAVPHAVPTQASAGVLGVQHAFAFARDGCPEQVFGQVLERAAASVGNSSADDPPCMRRQPSLAYSRRRHYELSPIGHAPASWHSRRTHPSPDHRPSPAGYTGRCGRARERTRPSCAHLQPAGAAAAIERRTTAVARGTARRAQSCACRRRAGLAHEGHGVVADLASRARRAREARSRSRRSPCRT